MADHVLSQIEFSVYNGYEDDSGYEQPAKYKTCRCCGITGLHWAKHNNKWRLFESGKLHNCKVNPLKETT